MLIPAILLAAPILFSAPIAAGQSVELVGAPLRCTVPTGWVGQGGAGTDGLVLGGKKLRGLIMVEARPGPLKQFLPELQQPIVLEPTVALTPMKPPRVAGKRLSAAYAVDGQPDWIGVGMGILVGQQSVFALSIGPTEEMKPRLRAVDQLLRSCRSIKPKPSAFAGKALSYHRGGNGIAERRVIQLCRDGSYRDESEGSEHFGSFNGNTHVNSAQAGSGRWGQRGNQLTLSSPAGSETLQLQWRGGELWIDGERWFVRPGDC